jgi:hypothetical protein
MLSKCARSKTWWLASIPRYRSLSKVITTHGATQFRFASISTKQAIERDTPQKKAPLSKRNNTPEGTYLLEKFDPDLEFASEELRLLNGASLAKIGLGDWAEAHR